MPRINVSRVINNPIFAKGYSVFRKSGEWVSGRWIPNETEINIKNVVTVPTSKDLVQIPEADRKTGMMCFHSTQELFITRENGTSDEIVWNNTRYRILKVMPWSDYGYWKAFGVGI